MVQRREINGQVLIAVQSDFFIKSRKGECPGKEGKGKYSRELNVSNLFLRYSFWETTKTQKEK